MLSSSSAIVVFLMVALIAISVEAFIPSVARLSTNKMHMSTKKPQQDERVFRVEIPLGEGYQSVITNFRPIFARSTIFVTTYDIPFSLNVEKAPVGNEKFTLFAYTYCMITYISMFDAMFASVGGNVCSCEAREWQCIYAHSRHSN